MLIIKGIIKDFLRQQNRTSESVQGNRVTEKATKEIAMACTAHILVVLPSPELPRPLRIHKIRLNAKEFKDKTDGSTLIKAVPSCPKNLLNNSSIKLTKPHI